MTHSLALDIGTTTLAGELLLDGAVVARAAVRNPQQECGADILARLQLAAAGEGVRLRALLAVGLKELVDRLCAQAAVPVDRISAVAAAGNPGISCLLRNLPVETLLKPPHRPPHAWQEPVAVTIVELGLRVPVQLLPLPSGFVGGDLVACLLGLGAVERGTLMIDIGTNAELALWDGRFWRATSAAAGPAFEGGNISAGMLLEEGAVTDVRVDGDRLRLTVAGRGMPRGVCGSGLAALVAAGVQGGLIAAGGRLRSADEVPTNLAGYLVERDGGPALRFYHGAAGGLFLTQEDIRGFQLAKGAVRAGVEVLLQRCGFTVPDVTRVVVTGALGTALPREVLKRVALLPEPMVDKTSFLENGVLAGLRAFLATPDGRGRLAGLMSVLRVVPLSGTPAFARHFLAALDFDDAAAHDTHDASI